MKLTPVNQHPEIIPIDGKIQALNTRKTNLEPRLQKAIRTQVKDAVDELLADPAATFVPREDPEELQQELDQIQQALNRLQQERSMTVSRLSQQVCTGLKDEHKKLVQRILASARALSESNAALVELFDGIETKGYSASHLRMMQCGDLGRAGDPESTLRIFERECSEYGFVSKSLLSEVRG